ncbi:ABC transporter permease [Candidatus Bipolaricaulota bacterium]|nr:ABC transporter permease [Candidatus Bipolaricaulota bacterium]
MNWISQLITKIPALSRLRDSRPFYLTLVIGLNVLLLLAIAPTFLNPSNFLYMFRYAGILGLIGIAETLIILAGGGGIDLSIGSMLSLLGVLHYILAASADIWVAMILVLPLGMLLGALNGTLTTWVGIPPFIATLATMFAFSGLALGLTGGSVLSGALPSWFGVIGQGDLFGVPIQFLVLLGLFLPVGFILQRTSLGKYIYAIGDNEEAARLLGISPSRIRFYLYMFNGFIAAIAAIMMNSWLLTARPDAGSGYELQGIAIAVLGGVDIFGGSGTLSGALIATIAIILLQTGMQFININPVWQLGAVGLLLVTVTLANQLFKQK